ncbi:MAG TPA: SCO family protein [Leucothrix sp.]|nr:SCO family protein [Leucothrix sp.]
MKLFKTLLITLFLSQLTACSPAEADKTEKKTVTVKKEAPKSTTPPANIVVDEDKALPMDKRGGGFTLYGKTGAVSLADYKGKVVAIYFGYTQCPDVCPTNLAFLGAALKQLSEKELDNVQGIFISVDPGRDTPELLADYTHYFHPKIIGVSGTPEMVDPVVAAYGAYYEKVSYSNSAMMYGISHTSETYIVGKDGKLSAILPHAAPTADIVKAIRKALDKK